ncbi:MAG: diguanylate cyclase [Acidobacteria bacterium]|nr:diguanylate cyclase [Acidobacteriota bacterium]
MKPEILLVEDDSSILRLLRFQLERAGFSLRTAMTVDEGRSRLKEPSCCDLILLDRRLPDGDGLTLCNEIRSRSPHAYILMLTGETSDAAKLEGFGCGADDYVTKPFQVQELLARIRAGLRIVELQKALLESNRKLEEMSNTDLLTSLRNRRFFERQFATMVEHAKRYERPLSVAMVDVDHFKAINDQYGHAAGDAVLKCVSRVLSATTRKSDLVARLGGEEFAVVLPETALFEALQFAEKIRASIATATVEVERQAIRVTASIGIANIPHSKFENAEMLLEAADLALYRAKGNGRNRVEMERRRERVPGGKSTAAVERRSGQLSR